MIGAGVVIGLLLSSNCSGKEKIDTVVKTETVTITEIDTIIKSNTDTVYVDKPVYIYIDKPVYIDTSSTGIVESKFKIDNEYFLGNISAFGGCRTKNINISGKFKEKVITNTDSIYIYKVDSVLTTKTIKGNKFHNFYFVTETGFTRDTWRSQGLSLFYVNRRFTIGAGIDYRFDNNRLNYTAKIGVKLGKK